MSVRAMAEMMILQAMEDLEDPEYRAESLEFFSGARFADCAKLAEMGHQEMVRMLKIVSVLINETRAVSNKVHARHARPYSTGRIDAARILR